MIPPITAAPTTSHTPLWATLCTPAVDAVATVAPVVCVSVPRPPVEAVVIPDPGTLLPSNKVEVELVVVDICNPLATASPIPVPFVCIADKVDVLPLTTTTVGVETCSEAADVWTV
jgi:hypothetical protein